MTLKEYKTQQKLIAVVLIVDVIFISLNHIHSPASFKTWVLAIGTAIILLNVSTGLMVEYKFQTLIDRMTESEVEYGIEAGENLQTTIDWYENGDDNND